MAHSRYAAAKITAVADTIARYGCVRNDPRSTRNSPTNPFVPGTPMLLSDTRVNTVANSGTVRAMPPYASIMRVWRRS